MKKNINIYSYPRSGRTFFYKNLVQYADETKIKKYHFFDSLLFNEEDVNIILLRNPKDSILSMLVMEYKMLLNNNKKTVGEHFELNNNLNYWSNLYKQHIKIYKENIDHVIPFTFEDVTKDVNKCIDIVLKESGYDLPSSYSVVYPSNGDYNKAFLKTSKSYKDYENFKKQINKNYFNDLTLIYEEVLSVIKSKKK